MPVVIAGISAAQLIGDPVIKPKVISITPYPIPPLPNTVVFQFFIISP
jgi:hypothetical protein